MTAVLVGTDDWLGLFIFCRVVVEPLDSRAVRTDKRMRFMIHPFCVTHRTRRRIQGRPFLMKEYVFAMNADHFLAGHRVGMRLTRRGNRLCGGF